MPSFRVELGLHFVGQVVARSGRPNSFGRRVELKMNVDAGPTGSVDVAGQGPLQVSTVDVKRILDDQDLEHLLAENLPRASGLDFRITLGKTLFASASGSTGTHHARRLPPASSSTRSSSLASANLNRALWSRSLATMRNSKVPTPLQDILQSLQFGLVGLGHDDLKLAPCRTCERSLPSGRRD